MKPPLFLLGAGFSVGAKEEAGAITGESIYIGKYTIDCGYPLVNELIDVCFPDHVSFTDDSIEELFSGAIFRQDYKPLKALNYKIMEADHYLIPRLREASLNNGNCYLKFIARFLGSSVLPPINQAYFKAFCFSNSSLN